MENQPTIAETFEIAVELERRQQKFFNLLADKFSHLPQIEEFWKSMANDEVIHEETLLRIKSSLDETKLNDSANQPLFQKGEKLLNISPEERIKPLQTLNDAYELAHELENGEFNMMFEFLVRECSSSEETREFATREIDHHLKKLIEFPTTFGDIEWRKSVKVEG